MITEAMLLSADPHSQQLSQAVAAAVTHKHAACQWFPSRGGWDPSGGSLDELVVV